jgi:hypothetical protein
MASDSSLLWHTAFYSFILSSLVAQPSLSLQLNCLTHGDDLDHGFQVKIASAEPVGAFKKVIKEDIHAFEPVDSTALGL